MNGRSSSASGHNWEIERQQRPESMHLSVMAHHAPVVDERTGAIATARVISSWASLPGYCPSKFQVVPID